MRSVEKCLMIRIVNHETSSASQFLAWSTLSTEKVLYAENCEERCTLSNMPHVRNTEHAQWCSQNCAYAVFGVCADEDFPINESTWNPIFRYFAHFIKRYVSILETSCLPVVFHPNRKANNALQIEIAFPTFSFTLSN